MAVPGRVEAISNFRVTGAKEEIRKHGQARISRFAVWRRISWYGAQELRCKWELSNHGVTAPRITLLQHIRSLDATGRVVIFLYQFERSIPFVWLGMDDTFYRAVTILQPRNLVKADR